MQHTANPEPIQAAPEIGYRSRTMRRVVGYTLLTAALAGLAFSSYGMVKKMAENYSTETGYQINRLTRPY
jgi:ferric-dicitrate binding protein FerR (iron transport regulator)